MGLKEYTYVEHVHMSMLLNGIGNVYTKANMLVV